MSNMCKQEGVEDVRPYFKRLYICYAACKDIFKMCRHAIGLDGCSLKYLYGRKILIAIGRGPNNQMLSIAFVVMEGGTKDRWS